MRVVLLAPYAPGVRVEEQGLSRDALERALLDSAVRRHEVKVIWARCEFEHSYWMWMRAAWLEAARAGARLVVVEHDIQIRPLALRSIISCRESRCAYAYWLHRGMDEPVLAHRVKVPGQTYVPGLSLGGVTIMTMPGEPGPVGPRWLKPGEREADYAGMGFSAFTPVGDWPLGDQPCSWRHLDTVLSERLGRDGSRWHIHWGAVKHGA